MRWFAGLCVVALSFAGTGCADSQTTPALLPDKQTAPATSPATEDWSAVAKALGRQGTISGDVYHVTVPRDDLFVSIEGMEVPTQAGLSSDFWFYRCTCGHISLVGQFTGRRFDNDGDAILGEGLEVLVGSLGPCCIAVDARAESFRSSGGRPGHDRPPR